MVWFFLCVGFSMEGKEILLLNNFCVVFSSGLLELLLLPMSIFELQIPLNATQFEISVKQFMQRCIKFLLCAIP